MELKEYRGQSFKALRAINSAPKGHISDLKTGDLPTAAHDSMRFEILFGTGNGKAFQEIAYRPAYHSLTDNDYGLLPGAEINFLNGTVRHYDDGDKYVLQKLDFLTIKSYSPISRLFTPISFDINFNLERQGNHITGKNGYALNLFGGAGGTIEPIRNVRFYQMQRIYGAYGGFLPHNSYLGASVAVGVLADMAKLKILAEAEKVFATSHFGDKMRYKAEAAYPLARNFAVSAKYSYDINYGKNDNEFSAGLRWYF